MQQKASHKFFRRPARQHFKRLGGKQREICHLDTKCLVNGKASHSSAARTHNYHFIHFSLLECLHLSEGLALVLRNGVVFLAQLLLQKSLTLPRSLCCLNRDKSGSVCKPEQMSLGCTILVPNEIAFCLCGALTATEETAQASMNASCLISYSLLKVGPCSFLDFYTC